MMCSLVEGDYHSPNWVLRLREQGLLHTCEVSLFAREALLRGLREVCRVDIGLRSRLRGEFGRGRATAVKQRLSFGSVVAHVLLGDLGGLRSMLARNLAYLLGLAVEHFGALLHVVVDQLLVGSVDERRYEQNSSSNQGKTPIGNDLRQEVREKSTDCGKSGNGNILGEQNTLSLDDEEVDKLVYIANGAIQGLTGYSVILARSKLRCKSVAKKIFSGDFGEHGNTEGHPCELEEVPDDVKVSNGEDQGNNTSVGNSRRSRIAP